MSHDTILHRCLRPAVGRLVPTPVSPDSLTVLRLVSGLAAASCFACGAAFLSAGAALFLLSMLLDRADGELARQSGRFSRFGSRFDLVADCVSTMAAFVALGIGASPEELPSWAGVALGLVAAVSTATIFTELNVLQPAEPMPSRRFDPDDAMLAVPVVIWCGGASWILLASGIVTPLAALLVTGRRLAARRRAGRTAKPELELRS